MASRWSSTGLTISAGTHAVLMGLAVFWGDIFRAPENDPIEIVETAIISEAEFVALTARAEAEPPAPEPAPPPEPAEAAFIEPQPPEPEPEPAPREPEPVPEIAAGPAPYDVAPAAPSDLKLDPRAVADQAADREIREALPPVRVSAEAPEAPEPAAADAAPAVDRAEDDPPPPDEQPEEANRPRIAEAPAQPQAVNRDQPPEPDRPDTPPESEPEEPQRVAAAPKSAPIPRLRPSDRGPQRQASAEDFDFETLNEALANMPSQPAPERQRSQRRAPSRPLSASEKAEFAFNFKRHWTPPSPGPDLDTLTVTLEITVGRDGQLLAQPRRVVPGGSLTPRQATAIFNAKRAVDRGAPYKGPPEKYDRWRVIRVTYDPLNSEATVN